MKSYFINGCTNKNSHEDVLGVKTYQLFVRSMLAWSDSFSFVYFKYSLNEQEKQSVKRIETLLNPQKLFSEITNEWPSMITLNEQHHIYRFTVYRSGIQALDALETVDDIYDWDYPKYPMDLCFYKNGYAWFASSAHERWNALYTEDDSVINILTSFGLFITPCGDVDPQTLFYDERTRIIKDNTL